MRLIIAIFLLVLYGCNSTKNTLSVAEWSNFKNIVLHKNIELEFEWAKPASQLLNVRGIENLLPIGSNIGNINLIGNPNYFKIYKDSLSVALPYYGEQQLTGNYGGTNTGVTFNGKPQKQETTFDAKKQIYELKFWVKSKIDSYVFSVTLLPNKTSRLFVNPTNKTYIDYSGDWKTIEKQPKEELNLE